MSLIYQPNPDSPAGEYAKYALSIFEGCKKHPCKYCYMFKMNKRFNKYFGVAKLKPALIDINILKMLDCELQKNLDEYQKYGIFMYFNSDPFLPETKGLTEFLIFRCRITGVEPTLLTKQVDWIKDFDFKVYEEADGCDAINFGFTLTGMDELEPGCSTNMERINALKLLHEKGFKTWVSLEPIINIKKSIEMFKESYSFVDHYKIGLLSGKKWDKEEIKCLVFHINYWNGQRDKKPILWKQSIQKYL